MKASHTEVEIPSPDAELRRTLQSKGYEIIERRIRDFLDAVRQEAESLEQPDPNQALWNVAQLNVVKKVEQIFDELRRA